MRAKLRQGWSKIGWFWRQAIGLMLLLGVAFIIAMACYAAYAGVTGAFPVEQREPPFYEILSLVLALAAIGITAFGVGAYRLLSATIERKVNERAEVNLKLANSIQRIDTGWLYWHLYQLSDRKRLDDRRIYLEQAITETIHAFKLLSGLPSSALAANEKLLIMSRNNWAYFIYEKDLLVGVSDADKRIALECLEYIESRISQAPEFSEELTDTIEKVAGRFRPATS